MSLRVQPSCKVLVVGAGALGSEIISILVRFSGLSITLVDNDIIEVSNLNRQLFYRHSDIGSSKSLTILEQLNFISHNTTCDALNNRVESLPLGFFEQFHFIISAVDNVESRLWLNNVVMNAKNMIVLLEGGSEGWMGHVRIVLRGVTPCLYCTRSLYPDTLAFPYCTLTGNPSRIEHCIGWAIEIEWPRVNPEIDLDLKNEDHQSQIFKFSLQQAMKFGIEPLDEKSFCNIIHHVIPAIVSTNSIVAGLLTQILQKIKSNTFINDFNFIFINGQSGLQSSKHKLQKDDDCFECYKYFDR